MKTDFNHICTSILPIGHRPKSFSQFIFDYWRNFKTQSFLKNVKKKYLRSPEQSNFFSMQSVLPRFSGPLNHRARRPSRDSPMANPELQLRRRSKAIFDKTISGSFLAGRFMRLETVCRCGITPANLTG